MQYASLQALLGAWILLNSCAQKIVRSWQSAALIYVKHAFGLRYITSSNTNSPTLMIAERGAMLVLGRLPGR